MSTLEPVDTSGAISYDNIALTSYKGKTVDVLGLFQDIHIFEDLFANTMSGYITLLDASAFVSTFPVIGQETLTLDYYAVGTPKKHLELAIYKIERTPTAQNAEIVKMFFVSKEVYTSISTVISKSFKGTYSDIAKKIFDEYLPMGRPLTVESSKFVTQFISPKWNPLYLMNWIAARAIPVSGKTPSYFFYETIDGFNFVSLETKFKSTPVGIWRKQVANTSQSANSIDKDRISYNTATIQDYRVLESFDFLDAQSQGLQSSEMYIVDGISNGYKKVTFNYLDEFKDTTHLNVSPLAVSTSSFGQMYNKPGMTKVAYSNSNSYSVTPDTFRYEDWTLQRMSFIQQLNGMRLMLQVAGQGVVTIGDIVSVEFPLNHGDDMFDPIMSGKYIVTAIHHTMTLTDHEMCVEVCKESTLEIPEYQ